MAKRVNKRRFRLINPKFQLKFACFISFLVLIPSIFIPYFILESINQSILSNEVLVKPEVLRELRFIRDEFLSTSVIFEVFIILFSFFIALFHSHRIAGPINRFCSCLRSIRSGEWPIYVKFRKNDNFLEIADEFNSTIDYISKKYKQLDIPVSTQEIISQLEEIKPVLPEKEKEHLIQIIQKIKALS